MAKRDREAVNQGLDALFGSDSGADLLGNVIRNDRTRTGRVTSASPAPSSASALHNGPAEVTSEVMTSQNVIEEYDNSASGQADNRTDKHTDKQASPMTIRQTDKVREVEAEKPERVQKRKERAARPGTLLERRLEEGSRMGESATMTVTLRIPRELNDWLDEYVHLAWPRKVKKQELVVEALRMLFARRGRPSDPVLPTELLPKEDND